MRFQPLSLGIGLAMVAACAPATFDEDLGGGGGDLGGGGGEISGPSTGGAGGKGGHIGEGGDGGATGAGRASIPQPHCTPEEEAFARKTPALPYHSAFDGGDIQPGHVPLTATAVEISERAIAFAYEGETGRFDWPSELPFELSVGAEVRVARAGDWQMLSSDAGFLAVMIADRIFGGIDPRFLPDGPTKLLFSTHCYVHLEKTECDDEQPYGHLFSVTVASEPLGLVPGVVARPGTLAEGSGWIVENHGAAHFPGKHDGDCIVETMGWAFITAYTANAALAPF